MTTRSARRSGRTLALGAVVAATVAVGCRSPDAVPPGPASDPPTSPPTATIAVPEPPVASLAEGDRSPAPGPGSPGSPDSRGAEPPDSPPDRPPPPAADDPVAPGDTTTGTERNRYFDLSALGYDYGSAEALVQVVEFSDFGCGYCRSFRLETFPSLSREFVETGDVAWKYVPFVLGMFRNGVEAATAGECAGEQGAFDAMSERLFREQGVWKRSDEPHAVFRRFAEEEGLDLDRFSTCVREGWRAERLDAANRTAFQLGIRGTPTFFIDGYGVAGALPLPVFRDYLARLLEERRGRAP